MSAPLEGIRVLEFGHYIAAPAATQLLSDLGAEVVKVEPPLGDQARSIGAYGEGIVDAYNRGKRSIVLDLKNDTDRSSALRLVDEADVLVQNLRAGSMQRLGLGPELLQSRRPDLIYVSVTAYNGLGPSRDRAGLDITAQAESGMMSVTGEPGRDPQRIGFPVADVGASYAVVQAVLAALFRRERTGEGAYAHVSLLDVAVHMQSALWGEWAVTGVQPSRKGNGQATVCPAADLIETADGSIMLSAYTKEHFGRLCRLIDKSWMLEDPRFIDNPARVQHRGPLLAEISAVFGELSTEDCVAWLSRHGIVAAAVRDYASVAAAPDVRDGGVVTTGIDPCGGRFSVPAVPFRLDGTEPRAGLRVPAIGEHTSEILRDARGSALRPDSFHDA